MLSTGSIARLMQPVYCCRPADQDTAGPQVHRDLPEVLSGGKHPALGQCGQDRHCVV